jgi:hypothetical protein
MPLRANPYCRASLAALHASHRAAEGLPEEIVWVGFRTMTTFLIVIVLLLALYFGVRWMLRFYFPPDS